MLVVMFVAVVCGAFGDISLRKGMKMVDATCPCGPLHAFTTTMTNHYVISGILMLLIFLLLYLYSLSWEDLSYVLPLTAADYVLVTLLAFFLLDEPVTALRWTGSVLVATGIALVARS